MRNRKYILVLSVINLLGCFGEFPWPPPGDWGDICVSPNAEEPCDDESANPVEWTTPFVELSADDFRIEAGGKAFLSQVPDARLDSDPGTPGTYTTFERTWTENGVEMRLFI